MEMENRNIVNGLSLYISKHMLIFFENRRAQGGINLANDVNFLFLWHFFNIWFLFFLFGLEKRENRMLILHQFGLFGLLFFLFRGRPISLSLFGARTFLFLSRSTGVFLFRKRSFWMHRGQVFITFNFKLFDLFLHFLLVTLDGLLFLWFFLFWFEQFWLLLRYFLVLIHCLIFNFTLEILGKASSFWHFLI